MILLFYKASTIFMQRCVISIMKSRLVSHISHNIERSNVWCIGALYPRDIAQESFPEIQSVRLRYHRASAIVVLSASSSLIHNASRGCIVPRCAGPDVEACRRIFTRGWREKGTGGRDKVKGEDRGPTRIKGERR